MEKTLIDIEFIQRSEKGYADIAYNSNGDLVTDESFDTTAQITMGTDAKASDTEVPRKELQRGTIVDLFNNARNGSKLWLLNQSRATPRTKNRAITYTRNAFNFLVEQGFLKNVYVEGRLKTSGIELFITFERFSGVFDKYRYQAWDNSLYKV